MLTDSYRDGVAIAAALKERGLSWPQVVTALNKEGFKNAQQKGWKRSALQNAVKNATPEDLSVDDAGVDAIAAKFGMQTDAKVVSVGIRKPATVAKFGEPRTSEAPNSSNFITREELESAIEALEKRLTATLPEQSANGATFGVPPKPPKEGRKFQGDKKSVRGLVDANLVALFEAEASERFDGNSSRALEAILWNHYGRPRLSFEE